MRKFKKKFVSHPQKRKKEYVSGLKVSEEDFELK